jgi:transcriptional regulator with XRE-family HTH domain
MGENRKLKSQIFLKFYTQAEFAQKLGVSDGLVSKIVRGRRKLDRQNQKLWADLLGCSPDELFREQPGA